MNLIEKVEYWGDAHHPRWLDILRIVLGLVIFAKGVTFISDTTSISRLVEGTSFPLSSWAAIHYIAFSHLVGGILIASGLLTRVAVVFQLPILIGAVFFVNIIRGFTFLNTELWVSLTVLVLLIVFFVTGSGSFSLDNELRKKQSNH